MKKIEILARVAAQLSAAAGPEERYRILLEAFHRMVKGDAVALLKKEGGALIVVACRGLSPDAMGRRFRIDEHPRLNVICHSKEAVLFPPDSRLADPYDGLVGADGSAAARVHSCLGLPLIVNRRLVGALTADALAPGRFDALELPLVQTLAVFAGAEMHTTRLIEALGERTERMCQVSRRLVEDARGVKGGELIGTSASIRRLRQEIELIARSDFSALITGETGAGKEVAARAIHAASKRRDHPLLSLDCAALPQTLVENELFGHVRGAFTGANADRAGKLELADGATLFLDEIGELPLEVQPKLLRFLQTGEIQRVGSNLTRRLNVRLLAATNRDLASAVKKGFFRPDLFHRLNVYPLHVPPLRERREDIPLIAGRLSEVLQRRLGLGAVRFRRETLAALQAYEWPGNVRELENVISRAVLRASAGWAGSEMVIVAPSHLGGDLAGLSFADEKGRGAEAPAAPPAKPLRAAVDDFQRELVQAAVARHDGNWAASARELGINRSNLHKLAKRLSIKNSPAR